MRTSIVRINIAMIVVVVFCLTGIVSAQENLIKAQQLVGEARKLINDTEAPEKKDFEEAFQKLNEAIKLQPNYYDAYIKLAEAYRVYTVLYVDKYQELTLAKSYTNRAQELVKKAISVSPNRPEGYHLYFLLLRSNEADEDITNEGKKEIDKVKKKLYELDPNNPEVMYSHGLELIDAGKVKEGVELSLKGADGLRGEGSAGQAKKRVAERLEEKGNKREAKEILDRLEQDERFNRAVGEIIHGDSDKGVKMVNDALNGDINKLTVEQKEYYAKSLESKRKYKQAADVYERIDSAKYKAHIKQLREKKDELN